MSHNPGSVSVTRLSPTYRVVDHNGMPFLGGIIPTNAAGIDRPDLRQVRERDERKRIKDSRGFKRALDEAELSAVSSVELPESVNAIEGNESEEGHEDRTEHGFYGPGQQKQQQQPPHPHIDIAG